MSGTGSLSRRTVTVWVALAGGLLPLVDLALGSGQSESHLRTHRAIREVIRSFEKAWHAGDAARLASLFAPTGQFVSPSGARARTRGEIRRLVAREHEQTFEGTRFTGRVEAIELDDGRTATVRGTYSLTGAERLGGFVNASRSGRFRCVLARRDGGWLIVTAHISGRSTDLDLDLD